MTPHPLRIAAALACGALVSTVSSRAHAYRPFDGTDAEVAEFGELEIEFGTAYTATPHSPTLLQLPAVVVNLGILPRVELVWQTNNQLGKQPGPQAIDAWSETQLLLKGVLRKGWAQEGTGPSIALEVGPWLPNPNGQQGWGGSADLITSFQLPPSLPMVFNVNLQVAYDQEHHPEIFGGVIIEGPRRLLVRPVTEIWAQHAFGGPNIYSALVGAIWRARKGADIDFGVEGFSQDGVPSARLRLGLTWSTELWHGGA